MEAIIKDVFYSDEMTCDIYVPEKDQFDTIVYFHGGGLTGGSKDDENTQLLCKHFQAKGYGVVNCNYHLYPNATKFQYVKDAAKAIAFAKANIQDYGGNGNIIVEGQSAGAWMIMLLALDTHYLLDEGVDPLSISAWIADAGQATTHFNFMEIEYGLNPLLQRIDEAAPLYFVSPDTKFSRMLLIVYEDDMANRLEQNQLLYRAIKNFNAKADIELEILPGGHCHGSCVLDPGATEFDVEKATIRFLNK